MLQAAVTMVAFFFVLQAGGGKYDETLGNAAFGARPLAAESWLLMIAMALGIGLLEEFRKARFSKSFQLRHKRLLLPHYPAAFCAGPARPGELFQEAS